MNNLISAAKDLYFSTTRIRSYMYKKFILYEAGGIMLRGQCYRKNQIGGRNYKFLLSMF